MASLQEVEDLLQIQDATLRSDIRRYIDTKFESRDGAIKLLTDTIGEQATLIADLRKGSVGYRLMRWWRSLWDRAHSPPAETPAPPPDAGVAP